MRGAFLLIALSPILSTNAGDIPEIGSVVYTPLDGLKIHISNLNDRVNYIRKIFVVYSKDVIEDKLKTLYGDYEVSKVVTFSRNIMLEDLIERGSHRYLSWAQVSTTGPLTVGVKDFTRELLCAPGDVVGVVFDGRAGGPENETYNAVPMNPWTEHIWNTYVTKTMNQYVTSLRHRSVELTFDVFFMYEDENSVRPYGLGVVIKETEHMSYIVKGYIPNPILEDISENLEKYVYRMSLKNLHTVSQKYTKYELTSIGTLNPEWRVERVIRRFGHPAFTRYDRKEIENEFHHNQPLRLGPNDVPVRMIGKNLTKETVTSRWNVVPMSSRAYQQFKIHIEDPIELFFKDWALHWDKLCEADIIVVYVDDTSFRPAGFMIHLTLDVHLYPNKRYSFIPNPEYFAYI